MLFINKEYNKYNMKLISYIVGITSLLTTRVRWYLIRITIPDKMVMFPKQK